jgi:hypothetical protein
MKQHNESPTSDPSQWSLTIGDQKDQDMAEPPKSSSRSKSETQVKAERLLDGDTTPKIKLSFGIPGLANPQALNLEASANPFASPGEGNRRTELRNKLLEEAIEGWSFQGRRHAPKFASPCQEPHQPLPRTSQLETTPGGKRGQLHSEVHLSFFTSLGIFVPPNQEFFRARVWPVLVREKNSQKETLVHSKNQARPSLPPNIRITGPADAEWSQNSASTDLTQHLEVELEEKVLRYRLTLKDQP